jgi:HSP20 family protein
MATQHQKGQQDRQQGESAMARSEESERSLAARQYQDPFSLLDSMFDRLQRDVFGTTLFNALLTPRASEGEGGVTRVPRVLMRDAGNALELTAELPGIDPKDVTVECEDDVLTISGESQAEEESDRGRTQRYLSFYRQVRLPDNIAVDQAKASYRNGALSIRFPKVAERSNVRQIPVSTEPGGQPTEQGAQQTKQSGQQTKGKAA